MFIGAYKQVLPHAIPAIVMMAVFVLSGSSTFRFWPKVFTSLTYHDMNLYIAIEQI